MARGDGGPLPCSRLEILGTIDPRVHVDLEDFTDIMGRHFRQPKEGLGFDHSPGSLSAGECAAAFSEQAGQGMAGSAANYLSRRRECIAAN